MKTFLKNIFSKFHRHSTNGRTANQAKSPRVVAPFVTRSNRYKPDELSRFQNDSYQFRFNLLSEVTEYQPVHSPTSGYMFLGEREMNMICIEAFHSGICCRDRDVKRYICHISRPIIPFTYIGTVCRNGMAQTV